MYVHIVFINLVISGVVFAKGFFSVTMPILRKNWITQKSSLAILRLDGDMYESTVDVLYNMYDKVSVGGFIIMDDWYGFPARRACLDFFKVHNINPVIKQIDTLSVYWQKLEVDDVEVQYWRYMKKQFK